MSKMNAPLHDCDQWSGDEESSLDIHESAILAIINEQIWEYLQRTAHEVDDNLEWLGLKSWVFQYSAGKNPLLLLECPGIDKSDFT